MREVEHAASDGATAIVLRAWSRCQYTRQGRLTSVNITKHCYPNIDQVVSVHIVLIYNLRGLSIRANFDLWVLAVAILYYVRFLSYLIVNRLSVVDICIWIVVCFLGRYWVHYGCKSLLLYIREYILIKKTKIVFNFK